MTHFPIAKLKRAEYNPRTMPEAEMRALMSSIESKGFLEPIVVNVNKERYGIIIGGHQRLTAVEKLISKGTVPKGIMEDDDKEKASRGYEIPCYTVDLTIEQEKEANIALNRIHGKFDEDKLFDLVLSMKDSATLPNTGLSDKEISAILHHNDEKIEKKDVNASVCERCNELKLMVQGHTRRSGHPLKISDKDFS